MEYGYGCGIYETFNGLPVYYGEVMYDEEDCPVSNVRSNRDNLSSVDCIYR